MKKCAVVLVAAGSGERFGRLKQMVELDGKPVIQHSLEVFLQLPYVNQIVVVLAEPLIQSREWNEMLADLGFPKIDVVIGGSTRRDSVNEGLKMLAHTTEFVCIHDGVRPFVPVESFEACIEMLANDVSLSAAIVASPCSETLKRVHLPERMVIAATINRDEFIRSQTPQVCRYSELCQAMDLTRGKRVTDEAQILELAGMKTAVKLHYGFNPKITYPLDLELAEAYLVRKKSAAAKTTQ
ncbi:MAG: 2-C-methyl-D-erythritol 4-phosphate cytidylyltransferase [Sumerlaeia bacterium]